jgi:hypothetical protein
MNNLLSLDEYKSLLKKKSSNFSSLNEGKKEKEEEDKFTEEDALKLLKRKCEWYFPTTTSLYRGMKEEKALFLKFEKDQFKRNDFLLTNSFSAVLLSQLPSWKKYPFRRNSCLVNTKYDIAKRYGEVYRIIPYNDVDLVIAPRSNIDACFKSLKELLHISIFGELDTLLNTAFRLINGLDSDFAATDIDQFKENLEKLNDNKIQQRILGSETLTESIRLLLQNVSKTDESVFSFFNKLLAPQTNGFQKKSVNTNLIIPKTAECWFNGSALAIREDYADEFLEQLAKS